MNEKAKAPYPYDSINGEFYSKEFLDSVWRDLKQKAIYVQMKMDSFSPAEKLAYVILKQITYREPED